MEQSHHKIEEDVKKNLRRKMSIRLISNLDGRLYYRVLVKLQNDITSDISHTLKQNMVI